MMLHLSLRDDAIVKYDYISKRHEEILGGAELVGDNIYIVSNTFPMLYIYNIVSERVISFSLPYRVTSLTSVVHLNDSLWLSSAEHYIYCLNLKSMSMISVHLPNSLIACNFSKF